MTAGSRRLRLAAGVVVAIAIATAAALALLWPPADEDRPQLAAGLTGQTDQAEVLSVTEAGCPPPQPGTCTSVAIRLDSGPDEGEDTTLPLGGAAGPAVDLEVGDTIRVQAAPVGGGQSVYTFVDYERRGPLLWLAIAFALLVLLFARLRGALSLVGLALSLAILLGFIVPSILGGEEPLAVAVAGALAVMLTTIPLAHGLGAKSVAAMLGTTVSLLLTAGLALAFTELTNLTGYSFEEAVLLQQNGIDISFQGLLLAGMVVGALGVLDDVTVSQASTVFALRAAAPAQQLGELFGRAMKVGRDHVSATVNTLVLAYAGAALPVLLIFGSSDVSLSGVINLEVVSREVVAMLVGSIGLIAAVPITTGLAAWLAQDLSEAQAEAAAEHGHTH